MSNKEIGLIIYFINLLFGFIFGNLLFCFGINVLFVFLICYFYHDKKFFDKPFYVNKQEDSDEDVKLLEDSVEQKPLIREFKSKKYKRKEKPDDGDIVYPAVSISKEEYENIKKIEERNSYTPPSMSSKLHESKERLNNFFENIENGEK